MMSTVRQMLVLPVILGISACLSGCVVAAVPIITSMSKDGGYTATVEVKAEPDEVHSAMLRIVAREPDLKLARRDDAKHTVEATRGKNRATATATLQNNGHTKLTVVARAGEKGLSSRDLARRVVEKVCDELGVQHRPAEK